MRRTGSTFQVEGVTYRLYLRPTGGFRVVIAEAEEDWDYENEEFAREMSRDVRQCRSYEEAIEALGLCGY